MSDPADTRVRTAGRQGRPAGTRAGAAGCTFVCLPGQQLCEILVVTLPSSLEKFSDNGGDDAQVQIGREASVGFSSPSDIAHCVAGPWASLSTVVLCSSGLPLLCRQGANSASRLGPSQPAQTRSLCDLLVLFLFRRRVFTRRLQ